MKWFYSFGAIACGYAYVQTELVVFEVMTLGCILVGGWKLATEK